MATSGGLCCWPLLWLLLAACSPAQQLSGPADQPLPELLAELGQPLELVADLQPLLAQADGRRLVLLGDPNHGSFDFYRLRALLTQQLVSGPGVRFLALEADWHSCADYDRYIRGAGGPGRAAELLARGERWPDWVWGNRQTAELLEWLREHNRGRPAAEQVRLFGIDLLGLNGAVAALLERLAVYPAAQPLVARADDCFAPYRQNPYLYAEALQQGEPGCRQPLARLTDWLGRTEAAAGMEQPAAERFELLMLARMVTAGEEYFRRFGAEEVATWNLRVGHFAATLSRLLERLGPDSRGVVWAHNTHVGDARASGMAQFGLQSLGKLLREQLGEEQLLLVGGSTYVGELLAARAYGGPAERLPIAPALPGSLEALLHATGKPVQLLQFNPRHRRGLLGQPLGQRAIGVVYRPESETADNYLATTLPQRYDALIFIDRTSALTPLD